MSDKAPEEGKKKKGKLPIIIAAVVVLGGGGFFMTKGKKKPVEEPALKAAKITELVEFKDDFLVNLADGNTYLRMKIALLPKDGVKKADLEKAIPIISDVVYQRMRTISIGTLRKPEALPWLRRQLASDINFSIGQLGILAKPGEEEHKSEEKGKGKGKKKDKHEEAPTSAPTILKMPTPDELEYPELDSDEGPVVKVLFQSFATQ
jgi:flagellar basal body-associated protein FliL